MNEQRRYAKLREALQDERSGRVVFLSHCLLNQNTRYLGGAVCPGVVAKAITPYVTGGTGIVQLPCPEQRVWGGVLKTRLLWVLDHRWIAQMGAPLASAVRRYVRLRYARLAKTVAEDVGDYLGAGFGVTGIVGIAGSPSCGAGSTIDLPMALAGIGHCRRAPVTRGWLNDDVIGPAQCAGDGWFVEALRCELERRRLPVPITEVRLPLEPAAGQRPPQFGGTRTT